MPPEIPTPPAEAGYDSQLLVWLCGALLLALVTMVGLWWKREQKREAEERKRFDKLEAKKDAADKERKALESERYVAQLERERTREKERRQQWEDAEARRLKGRETLLEEVRKSTRELHEEISSIDGSFQAKIEAMGDKINDLVLRIQRLEDKE